MEQCQGEYHSDSNITNDVTGRCYATDLLRKLDLQRGPNNSTVCDVMLRCAESDECLPAHRCVLAASSEYFQTLCGSALQETDSKVEDRQIHTLPDVCHSATLRRVLNYMYTGHVTDLDLDELEDVVRLADFLRMTSLLSHCSHALTNRISNTTCLRIKHIADTYSLRSLAVDVTRYVIPRMPTLIGSYELLALPPDAVRDLLSENRTNFVREVELFEAVLRYVDAHARAYGGDDTERRVTLHKLLDCLQLHYLTSSYLTRHVVTLDEIMAWLSERPLKLREVQDLIDSGLQRATSSRNSVDVIVCRSRALRLGERARLLVYLVDEDEWRLISDATSLTEATERTLEDVDCSIACKSKTTTTVQDNAVNEQLVAAVLGQHLTSSARARASTNQALAAPAELSSDDPRTMCALCTLDCTLAHGNCLYFIVTSTSDACGYMHHAAETKHIIRLDLLRGVWQVLPSPDHSNRSSLRSRCRLIDHQNGLYLIDHAGLIDEFDGQRWTHCAGTGFSAVPTSAAASATLYILPMPVDRHIYVLRAYSAGYAFHYAQTCLALFVFDTVRRTWQLVSDIEMGELGLGDTVHFYGYSVSPGVICFRDEFGQTRAAFDFRTNDWSVLEPALPIQRPMFVKDVYGSVEVKDRVYLVTNTVLDETLFVMFDHARQRIKATAQPPFCISGLMCHVTMPRSSIERITVCNLV